MNRTPGRLFLTLPDSVDEKRIGSHSPASQP